MRRNVTEFILKGVVTFLLLELLFFPLRGPITLWLQNFLPDGFTAVWECTGLDEVFLFVSFLLAHPSPLKRKLPYLLAGVLLIEVYNVARILAVVVTRDSLLHDILFRWGGFILVLLLFYFSFKRLSSRQ